MKSIGSRLTFIFKKMLKDRRKTRWLLLWVSKQKLCSFRRVVKNSWCTVVVLYWARVCVLSNENCHFYYLIACRKNWQIKVFRINGEKNRNFLIRDRIKTEKILLIYVFTIRMRKWCAGSESYDQNFKLNFMANCRFNQSIKTIRRVAFADTTQISWQQELLNRENER